MHKFRDAQQREEYYKTLFEQLDYVPSPTFLEDLERTWALNHPMVLNLFGFILYQARHGDPSALSVYKARGPKWMQEESNKELFFSFIDTVKKHKLIELKPVADYGRTYDRVSMTPLAYEHLMLEFTLGKFNSGWFAPYFGFWNTWFI